MINKFGVKQSRQEAVAEGRRTERVLLGFVALVVCGALGVGAGILTTRGGELSLPLTASIAPADGNLNPSNQGSLRSLPLNEATSQLAAAEVPAAAPTAVTADLVTRSIGTLVNAPLEVPVAPNLKPEPVALEETVPEIDTATLFSSATGLANTGCVEDLMNLARNTRIYFPSGGLTPDDDGMARARLIGQIGQSCPGVVIQVQGHSDPSGDPDVNLRLSQQRAQMVIDRIGASGVNTGMLQAIGLGDRQPSGVRGTEPPAHYDRRVEFSVVMTGGGAAPNTPALAASLDLPSCVTELELASRQIQVKYGPNAVTAGEDQLLPVYRLADAMAACPGTRLRITGQFATGQGTDETPATARIRAIAMMTTLVSTGVAPEQILVSAPSSPTVVPGLSDRRIDIDIVFDDT